MLKVLVVDDNQRVADRLCALLVEWAEDNLHNVRGYACSEPDECVSRIDREIYNIIVVDRYLGDVSGHYVLREVKKLKPFMTTIVLVNGNEKEDRRLSLNLADLYVKHGARLGRRMTKIDRQTEILIVGDITKPEQILSLFELGEL